MTWCGRPVPTRHFAAEVMLRLEPGPPALCGRTTPRPRRAVHRARLAHRGYIRALCSRYNEPLRRWRLQGGVHYYPPPQLDLRTHWITPTWRTMTDRTYGGRHVISDGFSWRGLWAQRVLCAEDEDGLTASSPTRLASISTRPTGDTSAVSRCLLINGDALFLPCCNGTFVSAGPPS